MSILTAETSLVPETRQQHAKQPGVLRSKVTLTLQTRNAQKFVTGRPRDEKAGKHQIPGLLDFGRRLRLIWLSVMADDPYADWQLLKTEALMSVSKSRIQTHEKEVIDCLSALSGLDVKPAESVEPIYIPLNFQNQYGYLAAGLLADYDVLVCSIFSAMHAGILEKQKGYHLLASASTSIRRLFSSTYEWRFSGVTRLDIKNDNEAARSAVELMGVCPDEVLSQTQRAQHAPEIEQSITSVFDQAPSTLNQVVN